MRRLQPVLLGLVSFALATIGLAALASAQQPVEPEVAASACHADLQKWADPNVLNVGDTAKVTMVISHSCGTHRLPIDLIFLFDESRSMTRGTNQAGGVPTEPGRVATPDPSQPTAPPAPCPSPPCGPGGGGPGPVPFRQDSLRPVAEAVKPQPLVPNQAGDEPTKPADPGPGGGGNSDLAGCANDAGGGGGGGGGGTTPGDPNPQPTRPGGNPTSPPPICPAPPCPFSVGDAVGGLTISDGSAPAAPLQPGPGPATTEPKPTDPGGGAAPAPTNPGGGIDNDTEPAGQEDLIRDAKKFVRDFLDEKVVDDDIKSGMLRVGLVAFNSNRRTIVKLTKDDARVVTGLNRIRGQGKTRIDLGMQEAVRTMNGDKAAPKDRLKVIVLLSDGFYCSRDFNQARRAKKDIEVVTVGFGRGFDRRALQELASEREYAIGQKDFQEMMFLYEKVLPLYSPTSIGNMEIYEELAENMRLVPNSANPAASDVVDRKVHWSFKKPIDANDPYPLKLVSPLTLTYDITPLEPGLQLVASMSQAEWTDSISKTSNQNFPDVLVNVIAPTPTPTPTSTHTPTNTPTNTPTGTPPPTNTPTPESAYLPVAFRNWPDNTPTPPPCNPEVAEVEVVAVVDTSDSMKEPAAGGLTKLDVAVRAVQELADALLPAGRPSNARMSVISFNSNTNTLTGLTNDRNALRAAIQALPGTSAQGTYIDRGLLAAASEIQSHARPGAKRHVVLLTDGQQQNGDSASVKFAATAIKGAGTVIWSIGLGQTADQALLKDVASNPTTNFRFAPTAEQLSEIYREIAKSIPCP